MYSNDDLNAAVAAGAISAEAADALRHHVAAQRQAPLQDEENFRLVTSFNDIFVTIGVIILLIAVGSIVAAAMPGTPGAGLLNTALSVGLPAAAVAATAWGLAEIFTRRRRMALPSIVLLLAFAGAAFLAAGSAVALPVFAIAGENLTATHQALSDQDSAGPGTASLLLAAALTALAVRAHWRRFRVPITIAARAGIVTAALVAAANLAMDWLAGTDAHLPNMLVIFAAGLGIFALAMRWDMSDRMRTTRRSDVAFWLHLLAAPLIVHPLFAALGVIGSGREVGVLSALAVIAIYAVLTLAALAIDRRALLVSALAYVLMALTFLFDRFGAVELNFALTALVIGSALLTLSAFWSSIRSAVLARLPDHWRAVLPPTVAASPAAPTEGASATAV